MNSKYTVFELVAVLCLLVFISLSNGNGINVHESENDSMQIRKLLRIHRRAISFEDIVDDLKEKAEDSANDVIKSAVPGLPDDSVVDSLIDNAISDSLDGIINAALDYILDDLDIVDDVKETLDDITGFEQTTPSVSTSPRTVRDEERSRLIAFIVSPVTSFVNRLRKMTQSRSDELFDALKSSDRSNLGNVISRLNATFTDRLGFEQGLSGIRSELDNRLKERTEVFINDLYSVVAEFIGNLTAEDIAILDRIENNRTREFFENNIDNILPILVGIMFDKASFDDLRCVITKSVLEIQFDRLFGNSEISQLFTDIFLAFTACYENEDVSDESNSRNESQEKTKNVGNMDETTEREFFQAMTSLVNSQNEANLTALASIADVMSLVAPSSSFNLENITSDLTSLFGVNLGSDIAKILRDVTGDNDASSSFSSLLESLFTRDNDDDKNNENVNDDDDDDEDKDNSYLSNLLVNILQPILDPLPLNDARTEDIINQLVEVIAPLASSTIQRATERAITTGVSNVLKQLNLSDEESDGLTQQITDLITVVIGSNPNLGDGVDLSGIVNQLDSSGADIQAILGTILSSGGGLGQNGPLSGFLPSELVAALDMLSTVQKAFSALTGIYGQDYSTSQGCQLERSVIGQGLQTFQPGALLFVDSMGKPGTGILQGNSYFVGNFDQCTTLNYVTSTGDHIKGQYIKYNYVIKMPPGFPSIGGRIQFQEAGLPYIVWGVCLPRGCTYKDAQIVGQGVANGLNLVLYKTEIMNDRDPTEDAGFICAMLVLGTLSIFCLIGTFLDVANTQRQQAPGPISTSSPQPRRKQKNVYLSTISEDPSAIHSPTGEHSMKKPNFRDLRMELWTIRQPEIPNRNIRDQPSVNEPGTIWKFFIAFSLPKNAEQILKASHAPGEITCLHGIRVISISWVILGHAYFFGPDYGNLTALLEMSKWWTFNTILNAPYTVDTFFVLSGCLVAYLFLKTTKKSGGLKPMHMFFYYVHRYLRLTPLLGLAILFYASVTPYIEYGPFQKEIYDREDACQDKWWWNILYINNLFDTSQFCMGWSWYLPNDMQFYAVAPLIIVPMALGYNFLGLLAAFLQIALHIVMVAYLQEKYDATLTKNTMDYFINIYIKPYSRCGPYAIGLVLGYAIFKTKFKAKISKFLVFLGWVLAFGAGTTLVFVTHDNYKDFGIVSPKWTADVSNAYEIVARPLWALCVAWMVFACSSGYGGVLNTILSWKAWIPLSRLTYGVYLLHVMVIHYFNNNRRSLAYFTKEFVIERYLATFILSYGLAFVASLLVETPIRNLTKPSSGKHSPKTTRGQTSEPSTLQQSASPVSALTRNGPSLSSAKTLPKRVSFENEAPRFGSNPYSSAMEMAKPASRPTTPTAPMMQTDDVNLIGETFRESPASVSLGNHMSLVNINQSSQSLPVTGALLLAKNHADSMSNATHAIPETPVSSFPGTELNDDDNSHVQSFTNTPIDSVVREAPSSSSMPEDVHLADDKMKENTRHDGNDNGIGIDSHGGSAGYPNIAYEIGSDESDWLSAALADGINTATSPQQQQPSTAM